MQLPAVSRPLLTFDLRLGAEACDGESEDSSWPIGLQTDGQLQLDFNIKYTFTLVKSPTVGTC